VPAWRPMPTEFALDRVTALLPFFVAGLALRPAHLELLRRRSARIAGAGVLAVAPVVAYLLAGRIDPEWAHWRRGYGQLGVPLLTGVGLWALVLVAAGALTAAFIAVVPARRLWFTRFGSATVYAYLLHGFVVHGASYAGWYAPMRGPAGPVVVTLLAIGLAFLLVTRPVRRATRWIVAPPLEQFGGRLRRRTASDPAPGR
jgi:fucose 4-O-acetylase-like acetyltransferase